MTIGTEPAPISYSGDGSTTAFPITWKYYAKAHVVATLRASDTSETLWVLDTDYTLTAAGVEAGGTLTATTAPASGTTLVIELDVPNTQDSDIPLGGEFPSTTVEDGLDIAAQRDAKLEAKLDRAMLFPTTDPAGAKGAFPSVSSRKGKILTFNSSTGAPEVTTQSDNSTDAATATGSTTSRTFANRFADIVNVLDYGATGDGSTNDATAIQAAIDALGANGGTVIFPYGNYVVGATITIGAQTRLLGVGGHSGHISGTSPTQITVTHTAGAGVRINGHSSTIEGICINGDATRAAAAAGSNYGILVEGADTSTGNAIRTRLIQVRVTNQPNHGIVFSGNTTQSTVQDVDVDHIYNGHGIVVSGGSVTSRTNKYVNGQISFTNPRLSRIDGHSFYIGGSGTESTDIAYRCLITNPEAFYCGRDSTIPVQPANIYLYGHNHTILGGGVDGLLVREGTDISFDNATSEIRSTTTDLSQYGVSDRIKVSGSTSNDGTYTVHASTAPTATVIVVQEALTTEAAGDSVTLTSDFYTGIYMEGQHHLVKNCRFIEANPYVADIGYRASPTAGRSNNITIEDVYPLNTLQSATDFYNPAVNINTSAANCKVRVYDTTTDVGSAAALQSVTPVVESDTFFHVGKELQARNFISTATALSLNDDEAGYWQFSAAGTYGIAIITSNISAAGQTIVAFRVGDGSAFVAELATATVTLATATGTLADAGGTDAQLNISADTASNRLYISNRTGANGAFDATFIGLSGGVYSAINAEV